MKPTTIFDNLIKALNGSGKLTYMKNIFKGIRENINQNSFPFIEIEPTDDGEIERDINQIKYVFLGLEVLAWTNQLSDPDKLIVGDVNYKGILDIENDIRAVLQSSNTLGNTVVDIKIEPTVFNLAQFPARGLRMPIRILYQQTDGE